MGHFGPQLSIYFTQGQATVEERYVILVFSAFALKHLGGHITE